MWKAERTPDAAGRLDNLKELVRSMGEFPDLGAFLEHVSLVMDVDRGEEGERVSIMTLHGAKGLRVRSRLSTGLGGGPVPQSTFARRQRSGWARGGAATCLCGPDSSTTAGEDLLRPQPPRARSMADLAAFPIHPGIARRPCRIRRAHWVGGPVLPIPGCPQVIIKGSPPATTRRVGVAPRRGSANGARRVRAAPGHQARRTKARSRDRVRPARSSKPGLGSFTISLARARWWPWMAPN